MIYTDKVNLVNASGTPYNMSEFYFEVPESELQTSGEITFNITYKDLEGQGNDKTISN